MNENVYYNPTLRQIKLEDDVKTIQRTYVSKEYFENNIINIDGEGGLNVNNIATKTDLQRYTTTEELEENYPTKALLGNYVSKTEMAGYITEDELAAELEEYATKDYVDTSGSSSTDITSLVPKTQIFEDGDMAKSIVLKTDAQGALAAGISVNIVGNPLPDNHLKNILIGAGSSIKEYSVDVDLSYNLEDEEVPPDSIGMSQNTVIGVNSTITQGGANNVVIGTSCAAYDTFNSVAVGSGAESKKGYGVAVGDLAQNDERYGIAIGTSASNEARNGISLGHTARNSSEHGISIGHDINNDGMWDNIAIGRKSQSKSGVGITNTLSIGYKACCSGGGCVAIGSETESGSKENNKGDSIAIGRNAKATGENSITIGCTSGDDLQNSADGAIVIGGGTAKTVKFGLNTLVLSSTDGITFSENPKVNGNVVPSVADDIITKKYVDDRIVRNPDNSTNTIKIGDGNSSKLIIGGYYISFTSSGVQFGTGDSSVSIPFQQ